MICTAFSDGRCIAAGALADVAVAVRTVPQALVFADDGRVVDIDTRGSEAEIRARLAPPARSRGRPALGVQAREVTLLPRQWDWLARQPGGASAALRRLVDAARRSPEAETRAAREAAYRFMSAIAGDLPSYEEALRALFAGDDADMVGHMAGWPKDVRDHALKLAGASNQ
jgi:hypothetical protein